MAKVLVVDDSAELLELFTFLFQVKGYTVYTSSTKQETFKKVSHYKPDVILLDVKLGWDNGREICKEIKRDKSLRSIPIILISANPELLHGHEDCEADDILEKPFQMDTLLEMIEKHIYKPLPL